MNIALQYERMARLLSPSAKRKALQVAPQYLARAQSRSDPGGIWHAALDALRPHFRSASAQELDVLAFYLVAKVESQTSGLGTLVDDIKGKLDGMNEMSEMTSLRLQMTMDRRSKFISTLSRMMKKISTTQDTLVQNIK